MARSTPKGLASARSEFKEQDPNTFKVNEMDFKMGQMDFNGYMSRLLQGGKITRQRERELQRERYDWQDKRNKERREAKPAREAEAKRIAGLSEKLVSEMQPYETALAQRIFDGEKDTQSRIVSMGINNADLLKGQKDGQESYSLPLLEQADARTSLRPYKLDDGTPITLYKTMNSRWIEKDEGATKMLVERLIAEGKNVQDVSRGFSNDKFLILTSNNGTKSAVPIVAYKQNSLAPTDADIMKSAKSTAKDVISSYATKLVKKTEELVGTGGEFAGKPKITLSGNNPWQKSTVELTMGGKKITWDTKMIWNISKLRNSFNQFPTRLVSQEDA